MHAKHYLTILLCVIAAPTGLAAAAPARGDPGSGPRLVTGAPAPASSPADHGAPGVREAPARADAPARPEVGPLARPTDPARPEAGRAARPEAGRAARAEVGPDASAPPRARPEAGPNVSARPATSAAVPARAEAGARPAVRRLALAELERLVRKDGPAQAVARAKVQAAEAQLLKAKLLWVPKARFDMVYSIVPEYKCVIPEAFKDVTLTSGGSLHDAMSSRDMRERFCMGTDNTDTARDYFRNFDPRNYFFRFELNLGQPLYTFGKIRHAKLLARRGVEAAKLQLSGSRDEAVQNLRRAYFGIKVAREMLFVIEEGEGHLGRAERRVAKALREEDSSVDRTDQYRLQVARADVDELVLKIKQGETLAMAGLKAVLGRAAPEGMDIDDKPLEKVRAEVKPLSHFQALAQQHRPEWKLLDVAVQAAKSQVRLRRAEFLPDLVLLMRYRLNLSTSKDDPRNAYLRDELHGNSVYLGLALRWDLDFHFKYADLARARAELTATGHMREQAQFGISLQVEKAHLQLSEAVQRLEVIKKARRAAASWLTTMGQRHEMGTATTRNLIDSLRAKFQTELRYIEAVHAFNMAAVELSRLVGVDVASVWERK